MKKMFFLLAVLLLSSSFLLSYEYIVDKNPKRDLGLPYHSGSVQITSLTGGDWWDGYYDLVLPANQQFDFYGRKVTHLRITTKGYIALGFGSAPSYGVYWTNTQIPSNSSPNAIVAVLWDDYDLTYTGSMWYEFYNTAGYYYTTVEWRSVPHVSTSTSYTFSVSFCHDTHAALPNNIIFYYNNVVSGDATYDYGKSATVGVEHPTGWLGEQVSHNTASVNNGDVYLFVPFVPVYGSTSFLTSGEADLLAFRPSDGNWYKRYHGGTTGWMHWGQNLDIPVPGDYDGDGDADECVYRPSDSYWYGWSPSFGIQYGRSSDIPVPADYDADGKMEIAVFRPSTGVWYIRWWTGSSDAYSWGAPGDIPIPGDIDNDGRADLVVWRPSNGVFYGYSPWTATTEVRQWGSSAAGDIPNLARNSGATNGEPLVFRPTDGTWYTADWGAGQGVHPWGQDGDVPMPVDWINSGYSWFMIFRPSDGNWFQKQGATVNVFNWGMTGDKPRCRKSNLVALFNGSPGESTTK